MAEYDLETLRLPKLSGVGLRLFAAAVDNPVTRAMLLPRLLRDGGVDRLRRLPFAETPIFFPPAYEGKPAKAAPAAPPEGFGQIKLPALPFARVRDYAAAYRSGETNPEEVAEKLLQAVQASDEGEMPLRAFIAVYAEDVREQARSAARRIRSGKALGPLDGVPVAVKDEFDMRPYPTTVGTSFLGEAPAEADATAVARLRAAGALLIGKANMHELGVNPNGSNAHYGPARNPYDLARDTGGSSSGPSVAAAAGLCPLALGADAGGSIRIPAALCGLVGLKPTYGRVSEVGSFLLGWSMAHVGPIGVSAEDVALGYALIAGPDPADAHTLRQPPVHLEGWERTDLRGVTIGLYRAWFNHASQPVVAANYALLDVLKAAGAQVEEIEVPDLDAMRIAHAVTVLVEFYAALQPYWERFDELAPSTRLTFALAKELSGSDYVQAQRVRAHALAAFADIFRRVDVILTPATAMVAQPIPAGGEADGWSDLSTDTEMMRFVIPANFTGYPAISFPAGYDEAGLPIGAHVMGRPWEEHLLLRIAHVAEEFVERRTPPLYYRLLPE